MAADNGSSGVDKIGAALAAVEGAIVATLIADSAAATVTAERLLRLRDSLNELLTCTLTGQGDVTTTLRIYINTAL